MYNIEVLLKISSFYVPTIIVANIVNKNYFSNILFFFLNRVFIDDVCKREDWHLELILRPFIAHWGKTIIKMAN